jgi:HEAT repeat protein
MMREGMEKPIIIDLDYFLIHVHCPEKDIKFSLDFSKKPRPFHLAVIALVFHQMKKAGKVTPIRIFEHIEILKILDKKLSKDPIYISKDQDKMFVKIKKAWNDRLKYTNDEGLFESIEYHYNRPHLPREYDHECEKHEKKFWIKLFQVDGVSNEKVLLKFAIDEVHLTLNDVDIIFKAEKEKAWERFIESLKSESIAETKLVNAQPELFNSKNAIIQFLKDIKSRFEYIKFYHTHKKVALKEQFISPKVTKERLHRHEVENFFDYEESPEQLKRAYSFKGIEIESVYQESWDEAKKGSDKIIILGDPGSGKSTLLMMEALTTADREIKRLKKGKTDVDDIILPIYLKLFDLAESKKEIQDDVSQIVKRDYPNTSLTIKSYLRKKVEVGKCLLLLDALDEVPNKNLKHLSDKIDRFVRNYPCLVICTSRIVGYRRALIHGTKEMEILPFSHKQIREYINTWFINAAETLKDKSISAKKMLNELRNKPQLQGLTQNPLLLSLICSLFQQEGAKLPCKRTDIYKMSVKYMMDDWRQKRNPISKWMIIPKIKLLEKLAYDFLVDEKEIFTKEELYEWTDKYIKKNNISSDLKKMDAPQLLKELSQEDGIFIKLERGKNRYIFLHRTFQEYFTASYLEKIFIKCESDGLKLVKRKYWDFHWHETIALLAGLLKNPMSLIKNITSQKDDIFKTLIILAGRCTAECQKIYHPLIDDVIERIFKFWSDYPEEKYIYSTIVSLGRLYSRIPEMIIKFRKKGLLPYYDCVTSLGNIATTESIEKLIDILINEKNTFIKSVAAKKLGKIGCPNCVHALTRALKSKDKDIIYAAVMGLRYVTCPESVPTLNNILKNYVPNVSEEAAETLGKINTKESVKALINALKDENDRVKKAAIFGLGLVKSPESIKELSAMLENKNDNIKSSAILSLGRIGDPKSVDYVIKALKDQNKQVRIKAVSSLSRFCCLKSVEALSEVYKYDPWNAASSIQRINKTEAIDALINILKDKKIKNREYAADALGRFRNSKCVDALIEALAEDDNSVRDAAITALGNAGNPKAISTLVKMYKFNLPKGLCYISVVYSGIGKIAVALGKLGRSDGIKILIQNLIKGFDEEKKEAAEALGKIGNSLSIRALLTALRYEQNNENDEWLLHYSYNMNALFGIKHIEVLKQLIIAPKLNIFDSHIFKLARFQAIQYYNKKKKYSFIPVYPEVVENYRSNLQSG